MMEKLMTPILIGAVTLLGVLVLSYYNYSDSPMNPAGLSPRYSIPPIDASAPTEVETATFALGCFWGPDALFGSTPGVVRTRVGYAGGRKENPTYHALGGHTETVQIDYDPAKISYRELLDIFWKNHMPEYQSWSQQYKSVIFYHNEEQKQLASETKVEREVELNKTLYTEIRSFTKFYIAEGYHQKFRLQREKELMKEFEAMYPEMSAFIDSTAAARVNGYTAGYGDPSVLKDELSGLGLTEKAGEYLIETFNERKGNRYC